MSRQAKRNNVVFFAVGLEFCVDVALVAVQDKHPLSAFEARFGILIEIPQLVQTCIVVCPSIGGSFKDLVVRKAGLGVPIGKVIAALHHQERRHAVSITAHADDRCIPLTIARLY